MPRISKGKIQPAGRAAGPASREKIGEQREPGTSTESRRWWPWSRSDFKAGIIGFELWSNIVPGGIIMTSMFVLKSHVNQEAIILKL